MGFDSEIPPVPLWTDKSQKQLDFTRLVLCLREQFISGKQIYISLKFLELLLKQSIFLKQQEKQGNGLTEIGSGGDRYNLLQVPSTTDLHEDLALLRALELGGMLRAAKRNFSCELPLGGVSPSQPISCAEIVWRLWKDYMETNYLI